MDEKTRARLERQQAEGAALKAVLDNPLVEKYLSRVRERYAKEVLEGPIEADDTSHFIARGMYQLHLHFRKELLILAQGGEYARKLLEQDDALTSTVHHLNQMQRRA